MRTEATAGATLATLIEPDDSLTRSTSVRLLRLVPDGTTIQFMRGRFAGVITSAILSTLSVVLFFYPGLNLGVDFLPGALGYAELARELGVDNASLIVLQWPLDTGAEAHAVAALLKGAPFLLVTSAYHMRRAVRLMQGAGQHPVPAPTGQRVGSSPGMALHRWLPSSVGMRDTEIALHEYLGLAALAIGIS